MSRHADDGPGIIGVKQSIREAGAGARTVLAAASRLATKAVMAPLAGLGRSFKPTPKMDAPAIRGGESAPVEVLVLRRSWRHP